MKAQDFLQAGLGHMQDRAATYDKPTGERSMAATVGAFKCVSGVEMTEEQGWLFMGLLKMVRSQQGEFKADNYEDEAAYAALRGECAFAARSTVKESLTVDLTGVFTAPSSDTASPAADPDGWIKWDGGECPVSRGVKVDVKTRDGRIKSGAGARLCCTGANDIFWLHEGDGAEIIAYRIHKAGE